MPCQMYCIYPAVCMDIYGYAYTTSNQGKKTNLQEGELISDCSWLKDTALSWQMKVKDINERVFP